MVPILASHRVRTSTERLLCWRINIAQTDNHDRPCLAVAIWENLDSSRGYSYKTITPAIEVTQLKHQSLSVAVICPQGMAFTTDCYLPIEIDLSRVSANANATTSPNTASDHFPRSCEPSDAKGCFRKSWSHIIYCCRTTGPSTYFREPAISLRRPAVTLVEQTVCRVS